MNCVLPAATGTRGLTGFRVLDAIYGALAPALPDRVMGASDGGLSLVTIGGRRPSGDRFSVVELVSGAWGGQAEREGQDGVPNLGANVSNIPVEMLEAAVPSASTGTGSSPTRAGSASTAADCRWSGRTPSWATRSCRCAPTGQRSCRTGSGAGARERRPPMCWRTAEGERTMPSKFSLPVTAGDHFEHRTAGAGGWGDALRRDPAAVADDVRNEILSIVRALAAYGW